MNRTGTMPRTADTEMNVEGPVKILVVDDSGDDRLLLSFALKRAGMDIQLFEVDDGGEAIDYVRRQGAYGDAEQFPQPDLVLLDLKMPGVDGFEVLRVIREHWGKPPFKVVVLSGSDLETDRHRAHELGATAYVVKPASPITLKELLATIRPVPA